jgi:hypothetical protein
LGLEGKEGSVWGEKKKVKKRQRNKSSIEPTQKRSSLSRSSKKEINYNAVIDLRLLQPRALHHTAEKKERKKATPKKQRLPQFLYFEFKRIKSNRKQNVKQAKRNLKAAEKEVRHARRQADRYLVGKQRQLEVERIQKEHEEDCKLLGCTKLELLQEIDRRTPELLQVTYQYDMQQAVRMAVSCNWNCGKELFLTFG